MSIAKLIAKLFAKQLQLLKAKLIAMNIARQSHRLRGPFPARISSQGPGVEPRYLQQKPPGVCFMTPGAFFCQDQKKSAGGEPVSQKKK